MTVVVEVIAAVGASLVALVGLSLRHVRKEGEAIDASIERERDADRKFAERRPVSPEVRAELFAQRRDLIRERRAKWLRAWDGHFNKTGRLDEDELKNKAAAWEGMLACDRELDELFKEEAKS